jgi:hypothetical protein
MVVDEDFQTVSDITWNRHFAALIEYGKQFKHCNVPWKQIFECDLPGLDDNDSNFIYKADLGTWLFNQRRINKKEKLSRERAQALHKLVEKGKFSLFCFVLCLGSTDTLGLLVWDCKKNPHQNSYSNRLWSLHYAALLEYCKQQGHCNVPHDLTFACVLKEMGKNGEDYQYEEKLGDWLTNQRSIYHGHKGQKMEPDRRAKLEELHEKGKEKKKRKNVYSSIILLL